ncbi:MAG: hypothetical protein ISQ14_10285 [Verrucomicrobiae bacterium]|jgi:hypothetical protein|nr:hypothetical protein [Verrucomicrobiae bacterium]
MLKRLTLILITGFWLMMNYLLWQRDFQAADIAAAKIPIDVVWKKMLRSADDSFLYVFHGDRRIGDLRWNTEVVDFVYAGPGSATDTNQPPIPEEIAAEYQAEGMVKNPMNYTVEIRSGRVVLDQPIGQVRYELMAGFSTNNSWDRFDIVLWQKENRIQFTASQTNELAVLNLRMDGTEFRREIPLKDFNDPQRLATALFGPLPISDFAGGLLSGLGPGANTGMDMTRLIKLGMRWDARQDWLHVGHSKLRTYSITLFLPENRSIRVHISRSGEILRVMLPGDYELRNNRLLLL